MASFHTSTPSPPPGIRTPPTPKHGFSDPWEPYSPRKSARISQKRSSAARTPSPAPASLPHRNSPERTRHHNRQSNTSASANMVSPHASPRKKKLSAQVDSNRRASGSLTAEGTASAAAALGIDKMLDGEQHSASTSISSRTGMLPTPAKTPQKPPTETTVANVRAIARNLFSSEDDSISSTQKKRKPKKYTGLSLASFTAEDMEEPIQIFTDSHDRVPTIDVSEENPFYGDSSVPVVVEPTKRRSKRNRVVVPGEGVQTIEEAIGREDGLVYVFRGKKVFRKFAEPEAGPEDQEEGASGASPSRPQTRSSLKPRLLFPPKPKPVDPAALEEEEAVTDVEDHIMEQEELPGTPSETVQEAPKTPNAPKFSAVMSPPTTKRTTRTGEKEAAESTPVKKPGRRSPFDSWPRVKDRSGMTNHKRQGEPLAASGTKRSKAAQSD